MVRFNRIWKDGFYLHLAMISLTVRQRENGPVSR